MKRMIALSLATTFLLAGCQTTNPYTGEQETAKSTKYAGLGAVAGALVGAAIDGKDGALAGALAGGLAGAGYGAYADKQEAALRAQLEGTGVQVVREGDKIKLIMPGNITFASSSANIKSTFYPALTSVATVMKEYDKYVAVIIGYTDSTGGDKINLPLSQARAESVASYLEQQGVPGNRLVAYGAGSQSPIASNATAEGRALNRRVEITLQPEPQG